MSQFSSICILFHSYYFTIAQSPTIEDTIIRSVFNVLIKNFQYDKIHVYATSSTSTSSTISANGVIWGDLFVNSSDGPSEAERYLSAGATRHPALGGQDALAYWQPVAGLFSNSLIHDMSFKFGRRGIALLTKIAIRIQYLMTQTWIR